MDVRPDMDVRIDMDVPTDVDVRIESVCRSCNGAALTPVLSLGDTPLADRLVTADRLDEPDKLVPLTLMLCSDCGLAQIRETVRPDLLFDADYPYFSSVSATLLDHSKANAEALIAARGLDGDSLVIEIASNDGYMLRNFVARGIPVLGIDPSQAPAAAAQAAGIETRVAFFGRAQGAALAQAGRHADLVIANNVLGHVADLNGLVEGLALILKDDGVLVAEVPYVADLIDGCAFDTIYHQHLCYFSVTALDRLFRRHGLYLNDVRPLSIHGGSLRLFVEKRAAPTTSLAAYREAEATRGLARPETYRSFAAQAGRVKDALGSLLGRLKGEGRRIAAYGAAAKGTTLLSYCGVTRDMLDYVVDRSAFKQGRYMPGIRLPVVPPERLLADRPDYVLLLPWNVADEILDQQNAYRAAGGTFIVPIPEPRIV